MKTPGPDHPITITPAQTRWRVELEGHVIADSKDALILKEADYPAVVYFPRKDVEMGFFGKSLHTTHCPYKGDASYYTTKMEGVVRENLIWSYEDPYPAMADIKDYVAFYPEQVRLYEVDEEKVS